MDHVLRIEGNAAYLSVSVEEIEFENTSEIIVILQ